MSDYVKPQVVDIVLENEETKMALFVFVYFKKTVKFTQNPGRTTDIKIVFAQYIGSLLKYDAF